VRIFLHRSVCDEIIGVLNITRPCLAEGAELVSSHSPPTRIAEKHESENGTRLCQKLVGLIYARNMYVQAVKGSQPDE
jgi:hypothetical protein